MVSHTSATGSPVHNGRSEDGHRGGSTSSRRRSRSRDRERRKERERDKDEDRSSSHHRSHKDSRSDRDRERDRDRGDPDSDRRRDRHRSRSRDRDYEHDRERRRSDRDGGDRDKDRRERHRDDREKDRDSRRRKRDESPEVDRPTDSKRRRDTEEDIKPKSIEPMDIDHRSRRSSDAIPPPISPDRRRERERLPPTPDFKSPRPDDRDLIRPMREEREPIRPMRDDREMPYDGRRPPPPEFGDRRRGSFERNDRGPPRSDRFYPQTRRASPGYDPSTGELTHPDDDAEQRSVFVSQLAARLTARDLGYFFEDKLGEGSVRDSRIVTDRVSRRSKGIAYVELASQDLVSKALQLSGTVVMGLPIMVQLTESERNKVAPSVDSLNLPPGVMAPPIGMQLYVGSLHFNLTESDIKQVFEPFGELDFVDLHKDPATGRSKGYAFVQYKRAEDAKMALEQMEGFELAGRQLRVNTVHEKNSVRTIMGSIQQDSLDEGGGTNLNNVSRQALMLKLARTEPAPTRAAPIMRANIPSTMKSKCILLKNMFDPAEETEPDWDKELEADIKEEVSKYGRVEAIKVEVESQGEVYLKFDSVDSASQALEALNGRWFGGKQVSAAFISDAIMQAHQ